MRSFTYLPTILTASILPRCNARTSLLQTTVQHISPSRFTICTGRALPPSLPLSLPPSLPFPGVPPVHHALCCTADTSPHLTSPHLPSPHLVGLKPVHLHQQLVERLLGVALPLLAAAANGVNLVNEHNARSLGGEGSREVGGGDGRGKIWNGILGV